MNDSVSRSWFCVLNNPRDHYPATRSMNDDDMCNYFADMWCTSEGRVGAWIYCISSGGLPHIHMVIEDTIAMRFSKVKKIYNVANIQATKGNKQQVDDYINKRGKFEEKGEKIVARYIVGDIKGNQGKRNDLMLIQQMVDDGLTPNQIIDNDVNMLRLDNYINKIYYRKQLKDTPYLRDVKVYWHFGGTGTGKSYTSFEYMTKYGRDNVYMTSATAGGGHNPFDGYQSQHYLFLDELRSDSPFFDFATLLSICNPYTIELQARYNNKVMLWSEVHITTPEMPYEMYAYLDTQLGHDKLSQLYRRINYYVYHYINNNGMYQAYIYDNNNCCNKVTRESIVYLAQKEKAETLSPVSTSIKDIKDIIQRAEENNIPCNIID